MTSPPPGVPPDRASTAAERPAHRGEGLAPGDPSGRKPRVPRLRPRSGSDGWRLAALAVLLLAALLFQAGTIQDLVTGLTRQGREPRAPLVFGMVDSSVKRTLPEAERAGLAAGDVVISIDGLPWRGYATPWDAIRASMPGEILTIEYRRPGTPGTLRAEIGLEAAPRAPVQIGGFAFAALMVVVMPLMGLVLGAWVVLAKPADVRAWILFFLLLSFGHLASPDWWTWGPGIRAAAGFFQTVLDRTWAIWMLLFGLYFPERYAWEMRRPWLKQVPVAFLAVYAALDAVAVAGSLRYQSAMAPLWSVLGPLRTPALVVTILAIGTFFANIAIKSATTDSPDVKRRLRIVYAGATVALLPLFVCVLLTLPWGIPFGRIPSWILVPSMLFLLIFPLTLAYAIVIERAMDVRVVLRMGARYLLVRNGLRLLTLAGILSLAAGVIAFIRRVQGAALTLEIGVALAGISLAALLWRRNRRALVAIDRRFFRDAYNEEQVLGELSEEVRTLVEIGPLLETVTGRIDDAIHVSSIAVLSEHEGVYEVEHARNLTAGSVPRIPVASRIVRTLEVARGPLFVHFDEPMSWTAAEGGLPPDERAALEALGAELLLPLRARGRMPGILALGPKRSEQPYSSTDLRLLRNVAAQTGLALENARLTQAIVSETARRVRIDREIEIAREVQERLFPQEIPAVPGLDLAGTCRPARGVGGDYYDFLALPNGSLGIAIGDVAGKGIPAALLMASLQASLRGQTLDGAVDLARLMARVNRLVHDASPHNRYATFFYAQYDPATRRIDYVNAGHNAPMLLRRTANGIEVERLVAGGLPVGLLADAEYRQASISLGSGDLLVGYTDGVSEAMNAADEEWGEERLLEAIRPLAGLAPAEVAGRIIEEADRFAAGAPQFDDQTLIVLRAF